MMGMELLSGPLMVTFLVGVITVLIYWFSTRNFDYWKKRNVPFAKPFPFVGSILENMRTPLHEIELRRCREIGIIYGHFEANRALLSVADPALLRQIFVKDFHIFPNRRPLLTGDKIVDSMLSIVQGEDWKRIRTIVTPTFTTGKLKRMTSIFNDCAKTLIENFKSATKNGAAVEVKRIYGAFTMDIIASSAFSTKLDSHNDPENEFVLTAKKIFRRDFSWRFAMFLFAPRLMKILRIPIFVPSVTYFFRDVTLQIIEERKRTGQTRNDFLQLLMDTSTEVSDDLKFETVENKREDIISNYGEVDTSHQIFKNVTKKNLSIDELVAQCIIFFLAGYDTTASTLAFATYNLALHQDIQQKLYEELVEALEETNGELTYDTIQNMKYLDNIISETLRLYPPAIRLERAADVDYTLGDTGITIPKGMVLTIPTYAIHRDPKNFPDPEKFDPDRFTPEERAKRDQYSYLPFGAGPRNCVAMRFALMEIKVCLAHVIANFKINRCPETKVPLDFYIGQGMLSPKEIMLTLELREDNHLAT